jgi:excisionase family DNA binding protein
MTSRVPQGAPTSHTGQAPLRLLMSVKEAAAAMNLSRAHTLKLVYAGTIVSFKEGKRRLIPLSALESYIRDRLAAEAGEGVPFERK